MYSEKLKEAKKAYIERKGSAFYHAASKKEIDEIILGFCNKEDLDMVLQEDALRLFDEYCKENGYPEINHRAVGHAFKRLWGVNSKAVRIEGKVKKIYFY